MSELKIVQLDLARQMEAPAFVGEFVDRMAAVGYDTLQLYLEARVATPTFSLPEGECYTAGDMRCSRRFPRGWQTPPAVAPNRPGCGAPASPAARRPRPNGSPRAPSRCWVRPPSAEDGERVLELELTLVDAYGIPRWRALARFSGEWREIAAGVWKPEPGDGAAFAKTFPFASDGMPSAVRLEYRGYGEAQVRFVSVADRSSRLVPVAVSATRGDVRDAARILVDDFGAATFGRHGFLDAFRDKALQEAVSSVTVELGPEAVGAWS